MKRVPTAILRIALVWALTTLVAFAETVDGPYVMVAEGGKLEAWYADPADGGSFTKRVVPVRAGSAITVNAIGARPAFSVSLRTPDSAPDPYAIELPKEIPVFLMADTHGEYEIATELLIEQGVIDPKLAWSFGRGHLVVLGDLFDRGAHQTELLWLLYKLEAEAQAAGGALHVILGNHEAMELTGDLRYLNSRYEQVARDLWVGNYSELWGADTLLGKWLRTKPAVLKLGRILCAHGGISPEMVSDRWSLQAINETVRLWLNGGRNQDSNRVAFITGRNGPLWHRGHVKEEDKPEDVAAAIAFYDVDRIAVGHTIVDTVKPLYGGSVIAVQVYPKQDRTTGKMNMEGVYVDGKGVWYRARIDGGREPLMARG